MCVRIVCVCMYVCLCMYGMCVYVCTYVCMYVCMHACMYACMCVRMCACTHVCMHVCMYVCMHVCMYGCLHVHMIPVYSSALAQLLGFSATLAAVAAPVPKLRLAHAHAASVSSKNSKEVRGTSCCEPFGLAKLNSRCLGACDKSKCFRRATSCITTLVQHLHKLTAIGNDFPLDACSCPADVHYVHEVLVRSLECFAEPDNAASA